MNVTFLSSTGTFNGMAYNQKKVDTGAAQLVHTDNMVGLAHLNPPSHRDYLEYMKAWSDRNSRVKNPQLHVAISVRGREKNAEELLQVAREWMVKMGYKDTPAMYFFHGDTENNHIHIISSRIGADGKKINDSNEIRRGVSFLREMDLITLSKQAERDRLEALGYLVETRAQLASVLSKKGYRIKVENDNIAMYKGKNKLGEIDAKTISVHLKKTEVNALRADQIRQALSEYRRAGLSREAIGGLVKEKLNIELVYFGKKDAPYGWSIIDHEWKTVYKGNEVLPLKELLDEKKQILSDLERRNAVLNAASLSLRLNPYFTSAELRAIAKPYGVYLKGGEILYKKHPIGELSKEFSDKLEYNDRILRASKMKPTKVGEVRALSRFFKVEEQDLLTVLKSRGNNTTTGEGLKMSLQEVYIAAMSKDDPSSYLREAGLLQMKLEGGVYLLDLERGNIELVDMIDKDGREKQDREEALAMDAAILDVDLLPWELYEDDRGSSVDNSIRKRRRR